MTYHFLMTRPDFYKISNPYAKGKKPANGFAALGFKEYAKSPKKI